MQHTAFLKLHPNREVRIGRYASKVRERTGADTHTDKLKEWYYEALAKLRLIELWRSSGSYVDVYENSKGETCTRVVRYTEYDYERDRSSLLDIIKAFQDRSLLPPKPAPQRHFGNEQRRKLLRSGAVMTEMYPTKGQTWEVTLTLPGSTRDAMKTLAEFTPWIMNRLSQVIRDENQRLSERGVSISRFYVWEWQKRGALHLHIAIGCTQPMVVKGMAHKLEGVWFDLLMEIRDFTGVDMFERCGFGDVKTWRNRPDRWQSHALPIQKSLAAYFAKYAGKDKDSKLNKSAVKYAPKTWWGRSRDLSQGEKERTIIIRVNYLTGAEADIWLEDMRGELSAYEVLKQYDREFTVERDVQVSENHTEKRLYCQGQESIRYYETEVFEQVKSACAQLAASMHAQLPTQEWSGYLNAETRQYVEGGLSMAS